jgi:uncharacterized protein DUF1707
MTGPMTGPEHLRVGDAERDEVAVALHDHFVQGRLTRDELDERLERTLSARTAGDLREVTRDLPDPRSRRESSGATPASHHPVRRTHRHPHPPVVPILFVVLLVTALAAGPGGPVLGAVRVMLLAWLALAVIGLVRHRRWHRAGGSRSPRA